MSGPDTNRSGKRSFRGAFAPVAATVILIIVMIAATVGFIMTLNPLFALIYAACSIPFCIIIMWDEKNT